MSALSLEVPEALEPLLANARYKAAYGGRAGTKSHFYAEQLILACFRSKKRAVCIREVQATMQDSVRQLLIDKIHKLGLQSFFEVLAGEIRGLNGSYIIFRGMQNYNAHNIKSLEDFDIAWVEEAQTLSALSLRLLRPTIRKPKSELWFSWNPRFDTDAVDMFFRGGEAPKNSIIVSINWYDNPWFNEIMQDEKDTDYQIQPEMAHHIWEGGYEVITEGSYFGTLIMELEKQKGVGHFPHNPNYPVFTSWDLGVDDYTAVWFIQVINGVIYIIDYYEASGFGAQQVLEEGLPEYTQDPDVAVLQMFKMGRSDPYTYQKHFLPHDVGNREWGAGAKTRVQTLMSLGMTMKTINRGVAANPQDRINAVRQIIPMCRFNQSKRVMVGLSRLRRYSRKLNNALGTYLGPLHDINSHGSDAFGEFAINCGIKPPEKKKIEKKKPPLGHIALAGAPAHSDQTRIKV